MALGLRPSSSVSGYRPGRRREPGGVGGSDSTFVGTRRATKVDEAAGGGTVVAVLICQSIYEDDESNETCLRRLVVEEMEETDDLRSQ